MTPRNILRFLLPLLTLASLAACTIGMTPPPPVVEPTLTPPAATPTAAGPIGSGLCANPLLPVVNGVSWSYAGNAGANGSYTFTQTITEVRVDGFTTSSLFNGASGSAQQWACKPEGLAALQIPGAGAALVMDQLRANFETSNIQGVILPASVSPGDRWSFSLDIKGTMQASGITADTTGTAVYDFTAVGLEPVTVPGGSFDAMRIDGFLTLNATASVSGLPLPIKLTLNTSSWYAPGVGMVRTVTSGDLLGTTINDDLQLQNYQIP